MELWKLFIHIFQATPLDLFTWGTYYLTNGRGETFRALCELLPHPFWDGKLWLLRYILQKAITMKYADHTDPLCPLSHSLVESIPTLRESPVESGMSQLELSTFALTLWENTKPDFDHKTSLLLEKLREPWVEQKPYKMPGTNNYKFTLWTDDVVAVRKALDSLHQDGIFDHDVREYYTGYLCSINKCWDDMPPTSYEILEQWDKAAKLRRNADVERNEPDFPLSERDEQKRLGYWKSPKCDPRFKKFIFKEENDEDLDPEKEDCKAQ
ncbi:uncharacterized protein F4822DRAFT_60654 [Hypoxylon trugodes]|uniref:uncharacterized protein n=1 Tax=Hypoxylon trugodes TaxID=326681 RepID=UPI0021919518|nr:uncharacterized protein F4822DRAFT_60654 [Hypoxylon trugodes]KAI1384093.1 hypothetical protein F4822DRAFT_60654 [Hypoxylon trugodes]